MAYRDCSLDKRIFSVIFRFAYLVKYRGLKTGILSRTNAEASTIQTEAAKRCVAAWLQVRPSLKPAYNKQLQSAQQHGVCLWDWSCHGQGM